MIIVPLICVTNEDSSSASLIIAWEYKLNNNGNRLHPRLTLRFICVFSYYIIWCLWCHYKFSIIQLSQESILIFLRISVKFLSLILSNACFLLAYKPQKMFPNKCRVESPWSILIPFHKQELFWQIMLPRTSDVQRTLVTISVWFLGKDCFQHN